MSLMDRGEQMMLNLIIHSTNDSSTKIRKHEIGGASALVLTPINLLLLSLSNANNIGDISVVIGEDATPIRSTNGDSGQVQTQHTEQQTVEFEQKEGHNGQDNQIQHSGHRLPLSSMHQRHTKNFSFQMSLNINDKLTEPLTRQQDQHQVSKVPLMGVQSTILLMLSLSIESNGVVDVRILSVHASVAVMSPIVVDIPHTSEEAKDVVAIKLEPEGVDLRVLRDATMTSSVEE